MIIKVIMITACGSWEFTDVDTDPSRASEDDAENELLSDTQGVAPLLELVRVIDGGLEAAQAESADEAPGAEAAREWPRANQARKNACGYRWGGPPGCDVQPCDAFLGDPAGRGGAARGKGG